MEEIYEYVKKQYGTVPGVSMEGITRESAVLQHKEWKMVCGVDAG